MASSSIAYEIFPTAAPDSALLRPRGRFRNHLGLWLPVAVFFCIFAFESSSYLGGEYTSAPLKRIAEALYGYNLDANWNIIHHLIRKTGHFAGYGLFSLFCFRVCWKISKNVATRTLRRLQAHGVAILATFLVASADEIHQCFVPNRFGQLSDVLLDTSGAVALGLMLFLTMSAVDFFRRRQANRSCQSVAYETVAPTSRPAVVWTSRSTLVSS
jgi:VanZ family protein